jgi:hypothetical protein
MHVARGQHSWPPATALDATQAELPLMSAQPRLPSTSITMLEGDCQLKPIRTPAVPPLISVLDARIFPAVGSLQSSLPQP